jgi:hypothetical protein
MSTPQAYEKNVFINCPFDKAYDELLNAILFAVHRCGFVLRCAKEFDDSGSIRIKNIVRLIRECKLAIHDLSRVDLHRPGQLPRFNMPLELGIYIGCIEFGTKAHREKQYLILEAEPHRFKQFISDLSGQDIKNHDNDPKKAVKAVRDWLSHRTDEKLPSASIVWKEFENFNRALPVLCRVSRWVPEELTFVEYSSLVTSWLSISEGKGGGRL